MWFPFLINEAVFLIILSDLPEDGNKPIWFDTNTQTKNKTQGY